jgi:hypothetical protein
MALRSLERHFLAFLSVSHGAHIFHYPLFAGAMLISLGSHLAGCVAWFFCIFEEGVHR